MGQKVNPHGFRVGVIKNWDSRWYSGKKNFGDKLVEDYEIREMIKKDLYIAGISKVEIERFANRIKVSIYTAKPGMVIGKGGSGVEITRNKLQKLTGKTVIVNVEEVKIPELDAQLTAESIASQIERRVSFRRAMKQSLRRTMKAGATGVKTMVAGRLNGADMARTEGYSEGKIPLQTIRANIEYGFAEADTTYGKIGVKVWISKGEILTVKEGLIGPEDTNKNIDTKSNNRGRRNNRRNNR